MLCWWVQKASQEYLPESTTSDGWLFAKKPSKLDGAGQHNMHHIIERESSVKQSRIIEFDVLRTICILWIVGAWHLCTYSPALRAFHRPETALFKTIILGMFFYISAYLLASKYSINSITEIKVFLLKRYLRIYPMYLTILAILLCFKKITATDFLISAFHLNMILKTPLLTLWFVTMIFLFYIITSILLYKYSHKKLAAFCLVSHIIFCLLIATTNYIDERMVLYTPIYCLGIFVAKTSLWESIRIRNILILLPILTVNVLMFSKLPVNWYLLCMFKIITCILSFPVLYAFAKVVMRVLPHRMFIFISQISFAMYLTHRLVFATATSIYKPTEIISALMYLGLICLPVIVLVSYLYQLFYDKIMLRVSVKLIA